MNIYWTTVRQLKRSCIFACYSVKMLFSKLLAASCIALSSAAPHVRLQVHEKRHVSSNEHSHARRVDASTVLPVRIALKQRNLEHGYNYLMDVSDPTSINYGQHWDAEQVQNTFAPHESSISAVKSWLREVAGIAEDEMVLRKGWLAFDIPARQAESLFTTEYLEHEDSQGNVRVGCNG